MIDIYNLDKFVIDDYVKDLLIGFYQSLFYNNESEFKYDPDKSVTRLNIADQFSTDDLTPEFKPTIYIRRRPFSFSNTSIDQFFGQTSSTSSAYTDLIAGTVEVVCVSSVELEACRLASIVFMLTNIFKNELRKKTGLFKIDVKALGEAQPVSVGSTMKIVEVPVVIQMMFQSSWILSQASDGNDVILSDIYMARSTNVATGKPLTGVASDGCGNGSGINTDDEYHVCIPMTEDDPVPIEIPEKGELNGTNCNPVSDN